MASFLSAFNELYSNANSDDNETYVECVTRLPDDTFHYWLLLPSSLLTLLLSFSFRRRNMCLSCLGGRPGAVFPMDLLGKSNRTSYAAAWGAISFLVAQMVFGSTNIVNLEGPNYVTIWNKILSVIVLAVGYFPMFAALALESVVGYMVATLYTWALFGIDIYKIFECDLILSARMLVIARDLPNLLCLGYLCVSLPVRIVQALRRRSIGFYSSAEMVSILNMDKDVENTAEAEHVRALLRPPKPEREPPVGIGAKVMNLGKAITKKLLYSNKHKFRYSSRILSVMLMGVLLVYKVSLEAFVTGLSTIEMIKRGFDVTIDTIGEEPYPGEEEWITDTREGIFFLNFLLFNIRIVFIVSLTLTLVTGLVTIIHMLASYRENLLDLYRGDNTHIPHRSTMSNSSLLVGSMRYAGYQVSYIAWGYVLHFAILFIVCFALCVVITLLIFGVYSWILWILEAVWPALLMTILLMMLQKLSASLAFLQGRGLYLAIENRRVLFIFSFFMFFYNIFIGFVSCLLRIIKSIVIGALMLPRLDNSALPRRFQMMDPGFVAYCGFVTLEASHTHPVLVMFLRLLMSEKEKRDKKALEEDPEKYEKVVEKTRAFIRARIRWQTAYSILNNPALRAYRKSQMDYVKQMQERLSKLYFIDKKQAGELVKKIDAAGMDANDVEDMINSGVDINEAAKKNWSKALVMGGFMQRMQRDMMMKKGMFAVDSENTTVNTAHSKTHINGGYVHDTVTSENDVKVYEQTPQNRWKMATFNALTKENENKQNYEASTEL
ncbi:receptor for retinol uptake stra6-like [Mya arenaria]|uniref:receptor for retinol uptake stra6-like n=1 Tax=Mya arenaria TaxID=6604 RepID=UPI0022E0EF58|nr:receptor for retinol uptake stra6-like [Mya arenaria]XP_052784292.1 receptor for retinol uptake stra6-like [Mya arenaria]XP_052784293.1 receptor for retinol uptake stra6-like [Mya arenaria]